MQQVHHVPSQLLLVPIPRWPSRLLLLQSQKSQVHLRRRREPEHRHVAKVLEDDLPEKETEETGGVGQVQPGAVLDQGQLPSTQPTKVRLEVIDADPSDRMAIYRCNWEISHFTYFHLFKTNFCIWKLRVVCPAHISKNAKFWQKLVPFPCLLFSYFYIFNKFGPSPIRFLCQYLL